MPKANGTTALAKSLGVSRQRAWQIIKQKERKCTICGKPAVFSQHCKSHRVAKNKINRDFIQRRQKSEAQ